MTLSNLSINRGKICDRFIERIYRQKNLGSITNDIGDLEFPVERFNDWLHDMHLILTKSILDVLQDMANENNQES